MSHTNSVNDEMSNDEIVEGKMSINRWSESVIYKQVLSFYDAFLLNDEKAHVQRRHGITKYLPPQNVACSRFYNCKLMRIVHDLILLEKCLGVANDIFIIMYFFLVAVSKEDILNFLLIRACALIFNLSLAVHLRDGTEIFALVSL